jgi:hypothetical protein
MNHVIHISGQLFCPDQQMDREFEGRELEPANPLRRDNETKAGRVRIEPDQQAILALARVSGAHAHRANGLIHAYTAACYLGEIKMAETTKREMTAFAVRCIRESPATDAG